MRSFAPILDWIDTRHDWMRRTLSDWAGINTASTNLPGLARQTTAILKAAEPLQGRVETLDLPPHEVIRDDGQMQPMPLGQAITIAKRPEADLQVLLCIHMDTVFAPDLPFQTTTQLDDNRLQGPGVADAKGGLLVMLTALQAFERSEVAANLGWQVVINPDEELGSPGSRTLLAQCARRHHLGLLFEPTLPDGTLIAARKGSGNYTLVIQGRSAHAGLEPQRGRNAIHAMADAIVQLNT